MPEIEVRPAAEPEIASLTSLDHSYTSDHVWQMDLQQEGNQLGAVFRQVRLPRAVRMDYPRSVRSLAHDWQSRSSVLVAFLGGEPVGYTCLELERLVSAAWMTDLVVAPRLRRQGIGSTLVLAALDWAAHHNRSRLVLEMQPRNSPAVSFAQVLGFDYAGYLDAYYSNQDAVLLFSKWVT